MNHLSFQPAFDVFHTEFRLLRLRRAMSSDSCWHYDQLRIADFYLLFFFRIANVRLAPKHRAIRNLAKRCVGVRYENQPDDQLVFSRMEKIHLIATNTLVENKFFDSSAFKGHLIVETDQQEPATLANRISAINEIEADRIEAIASLVADYDLLGPNGLKARTGLMEYRYDAI